MHASIPKTFTWKMLTFSWLKPLQLLTGEKLSHRTANTEDGARLDVKVQCEFFDIRVFYPNAQSNRSAQLSMHSLHQT